MVPSIPILRVSLISLFLLTLIACQNRAPSLRMLDTRAGYNAASEDEEVALYQRGRQGTESLGRKSAPRIARIYIYPHELPTKDYFWGGFVSLVVSPDEWILENPEAQQAPFMVPETAPIEAPAETSKNQIMDRVTK